MSATTGTTARGETSTGHHHVRFKAPPTSASPGDTAAAVSDTPEAIHQGFVAVGAAAAPVAPDRPVSASSLSLQTSPERENSALNGGSDTFAELVGVADGTAAATAGGGNVTGSAGRSASGLSVPRVSGISRVRRSPRGSEGGVETEGEPIASSSRTARGGGHRRRSEEPTTGATMPASSSNSRNVSVTSAGGDGSRQPHRMQALRDAPRGQRHNSLDLASLRKVRDRVAQQHGGAALATAATATATGTTAAAVPTVSEDGVPAHHWTASGAAASAAGAVVGAGGEGAPAGSSSRNHQRRPRARTLASGEITTLSHTHVHAGGVLGLAVGNVPPPADQQGDTFSTGPDGAGAGAGGAREGGANTGSKGKAQAAGSTDEGVPSSDDREEANPAAAHRRLANALLLAMHPAPHFQSAPLPLALKAKGGRESVGDRQAQSKPAELPFESTDLGRALRLLDGTPTLETHKIGVVYVRPGQRSGDEILRNTHGSLRYTAFLDSLGDMVRLRGSREYCGGLDRAHDEDGEFTYLWKDALTAVVFHVATLMPTVDSKEDSGKPTPQFKKTRFIGNDHVTIVYNDGEEPFRREWLSGAVNYVYIVVEVRPGKGHAGGSGGRCCWNRDRWERQVCEVIERVNNG